MSNEPLILSYKRCGNLISAAEFMLELSKGNYSVRRGSIHFELMYKGVLIYGSHDLRELHAVIEVHKRVIRYMRTYVPAYLPYLTAGMGVAPPKVDDPFKRQKPFGWNHRNHLVRGYPDGYKVWYGNRVIWQSNNLEECKNAAREHAEFCSSAYAYRQAVKRGVVQAA